MTEERIEETAEQHPDAARQRGTGLLQKWLDD
jgi:hypothetical protein